MLNYSNVYSYTGVWLVCLLLPPAEAFGVHRIRAEWCLQRNECLIWFFNCQLRSRLLKTRCLRVLLYAVFPDFRKGFALFEGFQA